MLRPLPPVGIRSGNAAMTAMAGMGHPATPSLAPTFRATIAIMAGCATLALALLAVANVPGPELPGFNGFFASGVFVAELATAYLLLVHFTGTSSWSVLLLAAAYLFSALMAVPYLLIFPGAVRAGEPLLGTPQSIAYIFASWTLGFAVLTTAAIAVEAWWREARVAYGHEIRAAAITSALVVIAVIVIGTVAALHGEVLPRMVVGATWTSLNKALNLAVPVLLAAGIAVILMAIGRRSDLFLWLSLALAIMACGCLLSTAGGARYTVGWYAWRLSWLISACALFLYFMGQFARQQGLLLRARDDLAERTRERDRIWSVSEDLLGVSTFAGRFISINPAWTGLLGWSEDEIKRMHVSQLRHPDDAAHSTAGRARLAEGTGTVRMENRFRHKDGTWRWIAWTLTTDQGLIYLSGRHVTGEREAQEVLRKAHADRAQLQKMEALGQLTGGVAHDFNNLLMIVSGYIARIRTAVADDPKAARAAEAIEIAAHRGQSLTRQLLAFSHRQPVNPVVVALDSCVAGVRPMLTSSVGATAELDLAVPSDLWPVNIDVNEFELALVNLVLNARDVVPPGGTITICARNVRLAPGATPENLSGEFVAVSVTDDGVGIAPDVLPRVFEPFFTTKPPGKGTGLGLSQVHGFAHRSGGSVAIASELGKGTVVTLHLPRADALPEHVAPDQAPALAGGTALLVEDNPEVAEVSKEMLNQLGYEVLTAYDAQRALGLIGRYHFDLVVSDIVMAGSINGVELARTIRAGKPDLPIILVTGYAGPADSAAAEFTVLRKPYQAAELRRAIAEFAATRDLTRDMA